MVLNCTFEHVVLTTKENEEGLSSLVRHPSFVTGSETHELMRRAHRRAGKQKKKRRVVVVFPTLFLANTVIMQNVSYSLESVFRNSKTQNYKMMRNGDWGSNERIMLTFLCCFLTST